jgi:myo-inositol-1(or 4)-monophosphatase
MPIMRNPFINTAVRAALAAGSIITRSMDRMDTLTITEKQPHDYVTEIDKASETEIIKIIHKAYPDHSIIGEEGGEIIGNDYTWIIDPLDGTRNYIHGFPHFAVSIALKYRNKIQHGVIYDPIRQELFTATRGKGAQLNERRIRVSKRHKIEECLLGTGFPARRSEEALLAYTETLQGLLPICRDIRRSGAATLDLAYVACGRFDGFWEMGLKPWDIAAGTLLIQEAGGLISDFEGTENYIESGNIITGNPKIFKFLIQNLSLPLAKIAQIV